MKDKYKGTWEIPSDESINNYKVVYLSERSIPDELDNETTQNAWVVVLSYILMFIYISIALGEFPSGVFNGFLLGFGGILIVAASMVGSIGIVSYLNVGMTMISAEVDLVKFYILLGHPIPDSSHRSRQYVHNHSCVTGCVECILSTR